MLRVMKKDRKKEETGGKCSANSFLCPANYVWILILLIFL
jgi:hypothetical protein